ncbi:MAG: hypothetical protein PVJ66_10225 [Gammaproteobacteria bacterium]|jgi:hypothetical protein
MHNQHHPDPELLDRLRAGLLDELPEQKARIEAHLAGCGACRSRLDTWRQLGPGALGPQLEPTALRSDLQLARHRALEAAGSGSGWSLVPYATAALLLIAVSVGLWSLQPDQTTPPQLAAQHGQEVPELYEDLDFYLWLADQENGTAGDDSGDANST